MPWRSGIGRSKARGSVTQEVTERNFAETRREQVRPLHRACHVEAQTGDLSETMAAVERHFNEDLSAMGAAASLTSPAGPRPRCSW